MNFDAFLSGFADVANIFGDDDTATILESAVVQTPVAVGWQTAGDALRGAMSEQTEAIK